MWKAMLNKSIRELRFVVKPGVEHSGVKRFALEKLEDIRVLNQNTFFSYTEITDNFKTPSAIHVIYGDSEGKGEQILTENLTLEDIEEILKKKVEYGLTLDRVTHKTNDTRSIPLEIVEARKYVEYMDDQF